ncbi:MAG TPA: hypothetical protein PLI44_01110 [Chiayiivirga sp.]|nr:hypothetical protein [Chiayiivirga sp.]
MAEQLQAVAAAPRCGRGHRARGAQQLDGFHQIQPCRHWIGMTQGAEFSAGRRRLGRQCGKHGKDFS